MSSTYDNAPRGSEGAAATTIADAGAKCKTPPPPAQDRNVAAASWVYAPMQVARRAVFYLLVAIYLIACPLTIGYALGYLVRPGSEHGIIKTGLVHLATTPPAASIYIGKSRYTTPTPATLRDLLPGRYPVSVVLKGYRSWRRTLVVRPGRATVFDHILLLPETLRDEVVFPSPLEDLIPVASRDLLLLSRGPQLLDLVLYDARAGVSWPIRLPAELRAARLRSLVPSRESDGALLRVHARDGERWLWLELRREPRLQDLAPLLSRPQATPAPVQGIGLWRRTLCLLVSDGTLRLIDPDRPLAERVLRDPALASLTASGGRYQIRALSDDALLFLGEQGELLTPRPPYLLVSEGVRDLVEDPRLERVLLWRADQLGVLDLAVWRASPERAAPRWIFQDGHSIEQAFWAHEGSHVVFRDGDQVRLLALDGSPEAAAQDVVQVRKNSAVLYVEDAGRLYYLDRTTAHLRALELIPGTWRAQPRE